MATKGAASPRTRTGSRAVPPPREPGHHPATGRPREQLHGVLEGAAVGVDALPHPASIVAHPAFQWIVT